MRSWLAEELTRWVREDTPHGDLTTEVTVPEGVAVKAAVVARSRAVAACVSDLAEALSSLGIKVTKHVEDCVEVEPGQEVMELEGSAKDVLLVERTLLNLMTYLFGVATATRKMVNLVRSVNPRARVAATRKVIPGLRYLAKKAVRCGGGDTHRYSLSDAVIIKDNHLKIVGSVRRAVELASARSFSKKVEVEVESVEEALEAAEAGADAVMFDNMEPGEIRRAVEILEERGGHDEPLNRMLHTPLKVPEVVLAVGEEGDVCLTSFYGFELAKKRVDIWQNIIQERVACDVQPVEDEAPTPPGNH